MIKIHEKATRGRTQSGLLDSYHTFSFGGFADPTRMGFGKLRVINEDTLIPGGGFAPHAHDNMDILTIVTNGRIRHEDDQGNVAVISAGEIQGMSAGKGVRHSEFNASQTDTAQFLQIWLIPDIHGGAPTYHQAQIPETGDVLLAGPAAQDPLIPLKSRVRVQLLRFEDGAHLPLLSSETTLRFVHIVDGLTFAEGERVSAGDGMEIPLGYSTTLDWATDGAALLFEMPIKPPEHLQ